MVRDLAAVHRHLADRGVPHAVIGAFAMAALGISRSTDDVDLLVTDRAVLAEPFWQELSGTPDIRVGDDADPLAGVVRLVSPGGAPVDVVVGKRRWQQEIVARAPAVDLGGGTSVPVATAADLVLLKLFAGGPSDLSDVRLVLAATDEEVRYQVEARVGDLPAECATAWQAIAAER